jgi:hypothetical protein
MTSRTDHDPVLQPSNAAGIHLNGILTPVCAANGLALPGSNP